MTAIEIECPEGMVVSIPICQAMKWAAPAKVIITVPHDGGNIEGDFSGWLQVRDKGENGKRAIYGRDTYVWPIVNDIARSGVIDAVRFLIPRAYVDANRPAPISENQPSGCQTAFDDERLRPAYDSYFGVVEGLVKRSIAAHGKENILFVDCHGFSRHSKFANDGQFDLILGTCNRKTVNQCRNIDRKFAIAMRECGYRVFLPGLQPIKCKGDPYSGGHMTKHIASSFSIDSIQIEIAPRFREKGCEEAGRRLARDMGNFFARHYDPA